MAKNKLLRGQDLARIIAGFEIEKTSDFIFAGLAGFILMAKLTQWDKSVYPGDVFTTRPDPITRATRMLIYRNEAERWREKHKAATRHLAELFRWRDFRNMLDQTLEGIDFLSSIIPLF